MNKDPVWTAPHQPHLVVWKYTYQVGITREVWCIHHYKYCNRRKAKISMSPFPSGWRLQGSHRCPTSPIAVLFCPLVALLCIRVGFLVTYIVRWHGHGGDRVRGVGSIIIIQAHLLSALGALGDLGCWSPNKNMSAFGVFMGPDMVYFDKFLHFPYDMYQLASDTSPLHNVLQIPCHLFTYFFSNFHIGYLLLRHVGSIFGRQRDIRTFLSHPYLSQLL